MRELAACSPVATPISVAAGRPGHGYPLPWAVQTWIQGAVATPTGLASSTTFAEDLAGLIRAFRAVDVRGRRFAGTGRGGDLADHDDWMQTCFRRSEGLLDVARLRAIWAQLRGLPDGGPDVMSHRDLIPANLLVRSGRLVGLLDGGDFGPADPSLDLVAAWHLLDADAREVLRRCTGKRPHGVAARHGVGVRTGHGPRLVLPRDEPRHERARAEHPHADSGRSTTVIHTVSASDRMPPRCHCHRAQPGGGMTGWGVRRERREWPSLRRASVGSGGTGDLGYAERRHSGATPQLRPESKEQPCPVSISPSTSSAPTGPTSPSPPTSTRSGPTTLAESRAVARPPRLTRVALAAHARSRSSTSRSAASRGDPVKAFGSPCPRGIDGPLPAVVEYNGYGGGRGLPVSGSAGRVRRLRPSVHGHPRAGLRDRERTGAPRPARHWSLIEQFHDARDNEHPDSTTAARRRHLVAPSTPCELWPADRRVERVAVAGGSQGGGIALAAAGLSEGLIGVHARRPVPLPLRTLGRLHRSGPLSGGGPLPLGPIRGAGSSGLRWSYFDG